MCMGAMPACLSVNHVCTVLVDAREGIGSLETEVTDCCEPPSQ